MADEPTTLASDVERLAREMWKASAELEGDWDGKPYDDMDWQSLMIESERARWRDAASRVLTAWVAGGR